MIVYFLKGHGIKKNLFRKYIRISGIDVILLSLMYNSGENTCVCVKGEVTKAKAYKMASVHA